MVYTSVRPGVGDKKEWWGLQYTGISTFSLEGAATSQKCCLTGMKTPIFSEEAGKINSTWNVIFKCWHLTVVKNNCFSKHCAEQTKYLFGPPLCNSDGKQHLWLTGPSSGLTGIQSDSKSSLITLPGIFPQREIEKEREKERGEEGKR